MANQEESESQVQSNRIVLKDIDVRTHVAFGSDILRTTHRTFIDYWNILMAVSIGVFVVQLQQALSVDKITTHSITMIWVQSVCFFSAFVRFFWGDIRYLDYHYIEKLCLLKLLAPRDQRDTLITRVIDNITKGRRFFDIVLLSIHACVFIALAYYISNDKFTLLYLLLLASNVTWMFIRKYLVKNISNNRRLRGHQEVEPTVLNALRRLGSFIAELVKTVFTAPRSIPAPRFWIYNNVTFFILIVIAHILSFYPPWGIHLIGDGEIISGFHTVHLLMLANSAFDFACTRRYYTPSINDTKELLQSELDKNAKYI